MEKKNSALNVPNALSLIRVILVPVFVATLLFMRNIEIWGLVVPAVVYALTAFTDMLDGKIARSFNMITTFGKFLDPLADKLTQFALLLCLAIRYPILWAVFSLFVLKELFQLFAGIVAAKRGYILKGALITGKVCTTVLFVSLVAMVIFPGMSATVVNAISLVDGIFLLIAFGDYLITYLCKISRFQPIDDTPSADI